VRRVRLINSLKRKETRRQDEERVKYMSNLKRDNRRHLKIRNKNRQSRDNRKEHI
jgi:hypothetical protein